MLSSRLNSIGTLQFLCEVSWICSFNS